MQTTITRALLLLAALALAPAPLAAQPAPALPQADRVRLAEAFRLADAVGDRVWPGWSAVPFAVLLVTPEHEFLVRHPGPSAEFRSLGRDSLLGGEVWTRPRTFGPGLLATFPAVGGVPTVVVGQPERTGKSSTEWVLTLLHEHFHQLQAAQPGYYAGVEALGLARGDQTGMWMLNYAFPYDSAAVQARFRDVATSLSTALDARQPADFRARLAAHLAARDRLRQALTADDGRYLAFQLWQEGIARWTEDRVAREAAEHFQPSEAFRALPDYLPFAQAAATLRAHVAAELRTADLGRDRRVAFYALGAATGLLLDRAAGDWQPRYLREPFALDPYLPRP